MRYLRVALLLLAVTFGTQACIFVPVSYTHLTLPTIYSV